MTCKNSNEIGDIKKLAEINEIIKPPTKNEDLKEDCGYDDETNIVVENQFGYKEVILSNAINVSNRIHENMLDEEKKKSEARITVMKFLGYVLVASLLFTGYLIYMNGSGYMHVGDTIIIALFTYVIANTFALMQVLVKYITENKLLDTFEKVTQRLLEFLINEHKETE